MTIESNLKTILTKIDLSKKKSPYKQKVKIVAATKTREAQEIKECYRLGIDTIGENIIQEANIKLHRLNGLKEKINKRFIGHLQTNKVNKCLSLFNSIDSVDSLRLAKKINKSCERLDIKIECLLEINTSKEKQKKGFYPKQNKEILYCFDLHNINIVGLMTLGPNTPDVIKKRESFSKLRKLKNSLNKELTSNILVELSMGMTNDFEIGIEEGSTMIRVGSGRFGPRKI